MKEDKLKHPRITIALTLTFPFSHRMALERANMMVICQRIREDLARLREEMVQLESIHSYNGRQQQFGANLSLQHDIIVLEDVTARLLHKLTHG